MRTRRRAAVIAASFFALTAAGVAPLPGNAGPLPGQIGSWSPSTPNQSQKVKRVPARTAPVRTSASGIPDAAVCLRAAFRAAAKEGLPGDLIAAIGLTESGRAIDGGPLTIWPWTVNSEGKGRYFKDKASAIQWVREEQARGARSIDVGCMQINLRWHPDAFPDLDTAFDPEANAAYSAQYLSSLRAQYGSLEAAVGRYHSPTPWRQDGYRSKVSKNTAFASAARRYLTAVAEAPTVEASVALVWGHRQGNQLAFTHGLFADAAPQPILPLVNKIEPESKAG